MKKLIAFLLGILVFCVFVYGFNIHMDKTIAENKVRIRDHRSYQCFWSSQIYGEIIDENTLLIFGSSELTSLESYENTVGSFLNGDEMNIITIGAGYFQSLSHTITLGAISDEISSKKIALFISPQWFDADGISNDAFSSRMSEDEFLEFLYNPKIKEEYKTYVTERTIALLQNSPTQLKRIEKYSNAMHNPFSIDSLYTAIMRKFWNYRAKYAVYEQIDNMRPEEDIPYYDLSNIDFEQILQLAENQGKESCTNNEFGIDDFYWKEYVEKKYLQGETKDKKQGYNKSVEYDDLRCFLSLARDLDFEVYVVSIPVNEKWYRYTGILFDEYYDNIRLLVSEYNNVIFFDMTKYADEKYFLRDIMHLGWKGWARINEELYKAFTRK